MMGTNKEEKIIIEGKTGKNAGSDAWMEHLSTFQKNIIAIMNIPETKGSAAEKFKKLIQLKESYEMSLVPKQVLRDIFMDELEKLQDVNAELMEDRLRLSVKSIVVDFIAGDKSGVEFRNEDRHLTCENCSDSPGQGCQCQEKVKTDVYNRKRERRMFETLDDSRLMNLLEDIQREGIEIIYKGIISEGLFINERGIIAC